MKARLEPGWFPGRFPRIFNHVGIQFDEGNRRKIPVTAARGRPPRYAPDPKVDADWAVAALAGPRTEGRWSFRPVIVVSQLQPFALGFSGDAIVDNSGLLVQPKRPLAELVNDWAVPKNLQVLVRRIDRSHEHTLDDAAIPPSGR